MTKSLLARTTQCKACNADMVFLRTKNDKRIPCDAATVGSDDIDFDPQRHTSHFATCPKAYVFRGGRV